MKWILGLDLGPRSRGALQFARWIAEATHGSDDFVGVHVLDVDHLWGVLEYHHLSEIIEVANATAHRELERAWPGGSLPVIEMRQALTVEDGLGGSTHPPSGGGTRDRAGRFDRGAPPRATASVVG
jgi:hypothetical protein